MATVHALRAAASAGGRRSGTSPLVSQPLKHKHKHLLNNNRHLLLPRRAYSNTTRSGISVNNVISSSPFASSSLWSPYAAAILGQLGDTLHRTALCESPAATAEPRPTVNLTTRQTRLHLLSHDLTPSEPVPVSPGLLHRLRRIRKRARRALRTALRAAQLVLTFAPLAALYPVSRLLQSLGLTGRRDAATSDAEELIKALDGSSPPADDAVAEWYLNLCLWCVESSGAAVIKLCQWASSRPDMFGERFCEVFGKLQDATTPHAWKHTEEMLRRAYGMDWNQRIRLGHILGSGCIGQVYKGSVTMDDGTERDVAVKVIHPGVKNNIDADLDLLAVLAGMAERMPFGIGRQLVWLDLPGIVEEFHRLLIHQLDFRIEAANLVRFNENFKDDPEVMFPELVPGFDAQEDVLVESFCDGIPFWKWNEQNMDNVELRKKMCSVGIRAVCQMIFSHNYVHEDLHPGNIFCSRDGKHFILLDAGMATEYDDEDHDRIVSILTAFIRMDGEKAGGLLIKDSNARTRDDDKVLHEKEYIAKIKELTDECKYNEDKYLMKQLGEYIGRMFDAAQKHHVLMNPAFVSCSLAVKVVEGVALALDPNCEIWRIANPIILQAEIERNAKKLGNKFDLDSVLNKVKGEYELLRKRIKYMYIDHGKHNPKSE